MRYVPLRSLWHGAIDGWTEPGSLTVHPPRNGFLPPVRIGWAVVRLVRAVAYEAVFATLDELDAGSGVNVSGVEAGWMVMESGEDGSPTGRALSGLHEELLTMDPSGRDGADLWQ